MPHKKNVENINAVICIINKEQQRPVTTFFFCFVYRLKFTQPVFFQHVLEFLNVEELKYYRMS